MMINIKSENISYLYKPNKLIFLRKIFVNLFLSLSLKNI